MARSAKCPVCGSLATSVVYHNDQIDCLRGGYAAQAGQQHAHRRCETCAQEWVAGPGSYTEQNVAL